MPNANQSYLRDALHFTKRAALGRTRLRLAGTTFTVAYEARECREEADFVHLQARSRGTHCVFDVGANVGLTSLVMCTSMNPEGKVYAFEASESSCLIVHENARLNGLSARIEVVNALIGARSGAAETFQWDFVGGTASACIDINRAGAGLPMNKATLALDDFVATSSARPDFIKIDVEGAEEQVLEGARHTLERLRPVIFAELHGWQRRSLYENVCAVHSLVTALDYLMVDVCTGAVVRQPSGLVPEDGSRGRARRWVYFFPRESYAGLGERGEIS